jgi:hypothetical protein
LDDLLYITQTYINPRWLALRPGALFKATWRFQGERHSAKAEGDVQSPKNFQRLLTNPATSISTSNTCPKCPMKQSAATFLWPLIALPAGLFLHTYDDMTEDSSVAFLKCVKETAPMKIVKLLTDSGTQNSVYRPIH